MWNLVKGRKWLVMALVVVVIGAACGGGAAVTSSSGATATPEPPADTPTPVPGSITSPSPTPIPDRTTTLLPTPDSQVEPSFTPGPEPDFDPAVRFSDILGRFTWRTDFSKHSVDYNDILVAQIRDGIPPVDEPAFLPVDPSPFWIGDLEPVISFEINGDARAYPLQIMTWHEIVNDTVGGVPVVVTFCPLCNTALVFESTVDGTVLDFGTTGMLRFSDLVMWDRQTETWWQQIGGEGIAGELTGVRLTQIAASIVSWQDFKTGFPNGQVLSRETGFNRNYGRNPYTGYDSINSSPFLFVGPEDDRLRPMERVATVEINGEAAAYPFLVLEDNPVVNDTVGGTPIVVFFSLGTTSALDRSLIASSRDIGATGVYHRVLDGRELTFVADGDGFVDNETGTRWNILGQAVEGSMAGKTLEPVVHANHFWFAWGVFKPETRIWRPSG
ncbi:MAG: DUF3179 domain-containing protein [Chloroflexi bacterium]|nr:DUF3179 domain-containing protein [Chloroflexota bacterium]